MNGKDYRGSASALELLERQANLQSSHFATASKAFFEKRQKNHTIKS
jgi:hypothetical protein